VEILPGQAVPRLELVEPRGQPLGAPCYFAVRPLAFRHPVFSFGGPASCPLACLRPLLLRDFPLEVSERSWEWPRVFHTTGARLLCRQRRPLVGLLIAGYALVGRAPPDLDGDIRPVPSQRGDVLPRLDGILLSWAGVVRCHPSDGRLRIRED